MNEVPKISLAEAKKFTEFAIDDPDLRQSVQDQIDKIDPRMPDEEREHITGRTSSLVKKYLDANGISWRLHAGYNFALVAVGLVLHGEAESVTAPAAIDRLRTSSFIESDSPDA